MDTATRLGTEIRSARKAAGITQGELGEFCHIDRYTIAALEAGTTTKQLERLYGVLDALGLEIELVPRTIYRARHPETAAGTTTQPESPQDNTSP